MPNPGSPLQLMWPRLQLIKTLYTIGFPLGFTIVFTLGFSAFSHGDFQSATEAYRKNNYAFAHTEFTQLAQQGDPRAQSVLAIMYKYGEGVPLDLNSAFGWYKRAAVQGYPPALYNVGVMLADGKGVTEDKEEAMTWLLQAADAGYERAQDMIAALKGDRVRPMGTQAPVAWSQSWNLRLPNQIRYEEAATLPVTTDTVSVYRVQLGALSTIDRAQQMWDQLLSGNDDLFRGYQPLFDKGVAAGRPIVRLQLGPFNNRKEAARFCEFFTHRSVGAGCLVLHAN